MDLPAPLDTSPFPPRRRVWQACTNCRARKTRCDAAKPKCGLCMSQNVECVYTDSQQPRIDHNTLILLERIQILEDRLLSSPNFSEPQATAHANTTTASATTSWFPPSGPAPWPGAGRPAALPTTEIPISLSHRANANHVLNWPVVQELLSSVQVSVEHRQAHEATGVFFSHASAPSQTWDGYPPDSWRLFRDGEILQSRIEAAEGYLDFICAYFDEVNIFFPLISHAKTAKTLECIVAAEQHNDASPSATPSSAQYCLLLLVLCMGSFVRQRQNRITLLNREGQASRGSRSDASPLYALDQHLWRKAQLLLGCVSSVVTIEAAQCTMLASIYMGARGRVPDSFHWSHVTSVKCATLAKRISPDPQNPSTLPEAFRRLYWVAFIYEGDFMSEISITLPSGIARCEDQVPYPAQVMRVRQDSHHGIPSPEVQVAGTSPATSREDGNEELVAFQISTNAAIRRLLNRVHSMVYDSKDQFRMTRVEYVEWLLRVSEDFWSYHDTIYRNIPHFLLVSHPDENHNHFASSPQTPGFSRLHGLRNNPWNVLRLEGRYHAAKHIIHRPFFDYVLLNMEHIQTHPDREVILQKCGLCLQGCRGFFSVFDVEEVNSMTCLFATGMATFTYLVILRVATLYPIFRHVLPDDVEHVIWTGKRNLQRFSISIGEFAWHLELLERLDSSCKHRIPVPM
ncbi:C6 finger domain-containing protein [Ilyonectria robusta]